MALTAQVRGKTRETSLGALCPLCVPSLREGRGADKSSGTWPFLFFLGVFASRR
jgi:hypothetical protein